MRLTVRTRTTLGAVLEQKLTTASRTRIRKLLKLGSIELDGKVVRKFDVAVVPGQVIVIRRREAADTLPPPFRIVFEDESLIVADKPAGLLSIAAPGKRDKTFYRMVNEYVAQRSPGRDRIYIVHRLDREVSGIMVFAKTPLAKKSLQEHWNETEKKYAAVVEGHPPRTEGAIDTWLRESRGLKVYVCPPGGDAKRALTRYRELRRTARHSVLEVTAETGRKHQIRVHLAHIGCPIVGDRKYGARSDTLHRIGLHAYSLSFGHPTCGERLTFKIPIPHMFSRVD